MEARRGFYAAIAGLLAYPEDGFSGRVARCRELLEGKRGQSPFVRSTLRAVPANGDCPLFPLEAAVCLAEFDAATRGVAPMDLEELYTRTFDFDPQCALEIGWHLFGADANRGALLVRLRDELARHGIDESSELPDHLTHVLPLLDRMAADEAGRFARACVIPAVEKLLAGLEGKNSPYELLVRCLVVALSGRFGRDSQEPSNEPAALF